MKGGHWLCAHWLCRSATSFIRPRGSDRAAKPVAVSRVGLQVGRGRIRLVPCSWVHGRHGGMAAVRRRCVGTHGASSAHPLMNPLWQALKLQRGTASRSCAPLEAWPAAQHLGRSHGQAAQQAERHHILR